jgi:streptomycin 6-kinase
MTYVGMAAILMGDYLPEQYLDGQEDPWVTIREFADGCPREGLQAAREIESWLAMTRGNSDLRELYLSKGGNYIPSPDTCTLRDFLEQVRAYLVDYCGEIARRAAAEHEWLPADLVTRVVTGRGSEGEAWLRSIPAQLETAASRWSLQIGPHYPLTFGYVTRATRADGSPAVLRLGIPGRAFAREVSTLMAYGGKGAVRLLEADLDQGAVLLEGVRPGEPLSKLVSIDDTRATEVVVTVLRNLWRPVPESVDLVPLEWLQLDFGKYLDLHAGRGPIARGLVADAARLLAELLSSAPSSPVLLHGDLHHDNILSSNRAPHGWLAIDPKGWFGDPGYDIAAIFYNPMPWIAQVPDLDATLRRRVGQLAASLGMDEDRLRAWAFVRAVLAEVWFVEDSGATHGVPLRVAEAMRTLI